MPDNASTYTLFILWILWCSMHSLLISRFFVAAMARILGNWFAYYRLFYNVFSLVTLSGVILYQHQVPHELIFSWPGPWLLLKLVIYFAAAGLFYGGYREFDMQYVLGLKQVRDKLHGLNPAPMEFNASGILEYIRHPWYSGAILFIWAYGSITDISLVSKMILTAYLIIGTLLEERKLILEIGEPYREYRKRVPMLIPWKINLK
jgi:protein-S-isoprenylcysteine O-methyltransferase Ste14